MTTTSNMPSGWSRRSILKGGAALGAAGLALPFAGQQHAFLIFLDEVPCIGNRRTRDDAVGAGCQCVHDRRRGSQDIGDDGDAAHELSGELWEQMDGDGAHSGSHRNAAATSGQEILRNSLDFRSSSVLL